MLDIFPLKMNQPLFSNGWSGSDLDSCIQTRYGLFIIVIQQSINSSHWIKGQGQRLGQGRRSWSKVNIILILISGVHRSKLGVRLCSEQQRVITAIMEQRRVITSPWCLSGCQIIAQMWLIGF